MTEEIKRTISAKQTEIRGAISAADEQLVSLSSRVEELNLKTDDQEQADGTESKTEALRQLEEERKALNASRTLLDELLSKSQEETVAKDAAKDRNGSTIVTFGSQNSGFQAGIINGPISGISFGGK
jgi:hypothetical protein